MAETPIKNTTADDDQEGAAPARWPFDALPPEIRDWVRSDVVAGVLDRLTEQYEKNIDDDRALPYSVTWLTLGDCKPQEFTALLIDEFGVAPEVVMAIAQEIKEKVFAPIKGPMRSKLGIDIELITTPPPGPNAQITKLAKPLVADIRKPVAPAAAATGEVQSGVKAQTTRMAQPFAAINRPEAAAKPAAPKPVTPANTANKAEINSQFGFVEVTPTPPPGFNPASVAAPTPQPKTEPKSSGSLPAVPQQPPAIPHDVVPYKDEHPAKQGG